MTPHFNTHIEGIDLEFWHELIERYGSFVTLHSGESVCAKGVPTNKFGYVKSGYLKYCIAEFNKQEILGGFAFPGALFGDYPGCLYNDIPMFDISAGRKSEVWVMDATILETLYKENAYLCNKGRLLMESFGRSLLRRYCDLHCKTPTERYIQLINSHPQIEQDIPQKEIAEYLHITPTHLCRIRKELLRLNTSTYVDN